MKNVFYGTVFCVLGCFSCQYTTPCRSMNGTWTNKEGQDLIFLTADSALWLTRFGSTTDTIGFMYHMICKNQPALIEWTRFTNGPYSGKTLYGILEWLSDTSFRVRYEPGIQEQVRPAEFDNQQTIRFVRKQD
jgi:hypothetical protein